MRCQREVAFLQHGRVFLPSSTLHIVLGAMGAGFQERHPTGHQDFGRCRLLPAVVVVSLGPMQDSQALLPSLTSGGQSRDKRESTVKLGGITVVRLRLYIWPCARLRPTCRLLRPSFLCGCISPALCESHHTVLGAGRGAGGCSCLEGAQPRVPQFSENMLEGPPFMGPSIRHWGFRVEVT